MAFHNRALAYRWRGDFDRAKSDFEQANRLDPSAAGNRASAYRTRRDDDRVIQEVNQTIRPSVAEELTKVGLRAMR